MYHGEHPASHHQFSMVGPLYSALDANHCEPLKILKIADECLSDYLRIPSHIRRKKVVPLSVKRSWTVLRLVTNPDTKRTRISTNAKRHPKAAFNTLFSLCYFGCGSRILTYDLQVMSRGEQTMSNHSELRFTSRFREVRRNSRNTVFARLRTNRPRFAPSCFHIASTQAKFDVPVAWRS
jgi:hypothetical protein